MGDPIEARLAVTYLGREPVLCHLCEQEFRDEPNLATVDVIVEVWLGWKGASCVFPVCAEHEVEARALLAVAIKPEEPSDGA